MNIGVFSFLLVVFTLPFVGGILLVLNGGALSTIIGAINFLCYGTVTLILLSAARGD